MEAAVGSRPGMDVQAWFVASIVVMAAHKVECWRYEEWLESPFFSALIQVAPSLGPTQAHMVGESIFLVFVFWLFVGMTMVAMVMRGGVAAKIALMGWGMTFLLEWHHLARSLSAWSYYPGLYTAPLYLALGPGYRWALLRWHASDPE